MKINGSLHSKIFFQIVNRICPVPPKLCGWGIKHDPLSTGPRRRRSMRRGPKSKMEVARRRRSRWRKWWNWGWKETWKSELQAGCKKSPLRSLILQYCRSNRNFLNTTQRKKFWGRLDFYPALPRSTMTFALYSATYICWTARSMERSIFFFLKIHISAPGERNCPNFFFYGSFPIIFSCYKWFLSRLGPLHGQNWRNVSKKCLFGCPKPKSLKMTKIAPLTQATWNKKTNFSQFSGLSRLVLMTGKLSKSNFI